MEMQRKWHINDGKIDLQKHKRHFHVQHFLTSEWFNNTHFCIGSPFAFWIDQKLKCHEWMTPISSSVSFDTCETLQNVWNAGRSWRVEKFEFRLAAKWANCKLQKHSIVTTDDGHNDITCQLSTLWMYCDWFRAHNEHITSSKLAFVNLATSRNRTMYVHIEHHPFGTSMI